MAMTKSPDEEPRIRQEIQALHDKKEAIYRQPSILGTFSIEVTIAINSVLNFISALPKNRRSNKKRQRNDDDSDEESDFSGSDEYATAAPKRRFSTGTASPSGTPPPSNRSSPPRDSDLPPNALILPPLRSVGFNTSPMMPNQLSLELPRIHLLNEKCDEPRQQQQQDSRAAMGAFHMLALAAESLDDVRAPLADDDEKCAQPTRMSFSVVDGTREASC